MPELPTQPAENRPPDNQDPALQIHVLRSEELLRGRREVIIEHGTETYRLRLTRNGKLILQK